MPHFKRDKTVQQYRHEVRDAVKQAHRDLRDAPPEVAEKIAELRSEIDGLTKNVVRTLRGLVGLPQEVQVERLTAARVDVEAAKVLVTKAAEKFATGTADNTALKEIRDESLKLAKETLTDAIAYAKGRNFEKHQADKAAKLAAEDESDYADASF